MSDCTKHAFPSVHAAATVLRALRKKPARSECAIHFCGQCRAYHLTSKAKSRKNKWTRQATPEPAASA